MDEFGKCDLQLHLDAHTPFLPIVTRFVETTASLFDLGKDEALKLVLATEEIFVHLCSAVCPGGPLEVSCRDGLYYTRVAFRFSAPTLNLKGLNIASADEGGCDLEEMGLMIASRSVDDLHLTMEKGNRVCLAVTKHKAYPRVSEEFPRPEAPQRVVSQTADREQVKRFTLMASLFCRQQDLPPFFDYPGRVADMVAGGEYGCLIGLGQNQQIVGGILFCRRSERIVQFFGPYIFHGGAVTATAEALLEDLLARIARTKALGLLSLSGLPKALEQRFESLGSLSSQVEELPPVRKPFFFRHLHEDPGGEVWSTEALNDWLCAQYDRLVLARQIQTVRDMGERRSGASLFAAEISREKAEACLRPLLPGDDPAVNVKAHVRYLREDGLSTLLFEIDLGVSWHAELTEVLLAEGFQPKILLPFAGRSDLVIFQHHDATEP